MKKLLSLLIALAVCAGGVGFWYYRAHGSQATQFRTTRVERGPITATIAATGTVEPEEVIDIGAQVVGRIERFGLDPAYTSARDALALVAAYPAPGASLALAAARANPPRSIDYTSEV